MNDIPSRFRALITEKTSDARRWAELESLTAIPATSWNKAYHGKQRPTSDMLQALARLWPEHTFWLMTGVTDSKNGHIACGKSSAAYPEAAPPFNNPISALYFAKAISMVTALERDGGERQDKVAEAADIRDLAVLEATRDTIDNATRGLAHPKPSQPN